MLCQVIICSVSDTPKFTPAKREFEFEVCCCSVEEAKNKALNEQGVEFIYPDTAPFQQAVMPLHNEVLAASPALQPIYDMIQAYNAQYAAAE